MPVAIFPTYSHPPDKLPEKGEQWSRFIPKGAVHDSSKRARNVHVRTVGPAAAPSRPNARILRGTIALFNPEKKEVKKVKQPIEWRWEATCHPIRPGLYVWSALALVSDTITDQGVFTPEALDLLAVRAYAYPNEPLTLVEQVALFMAGCLNAFAARNPSVIANDMADKLPTEWD